MKKVFLSLLLIVVPFALHVVSQTVTYNAQIFFVTRYFESRPAIKGVKLGKMEYPRLVGTESYVVPFNKAIRKLIEKEVEQTRKDYLENIKNQKAELDRELKGIYELELSYSINFADHDFISVSLTFIVDDLTHEENAEPSLGMRTGRQRAINYSIRRQEFLKMKELFKPNSAYLKFISDYLTRVVKKTYAGSDYLLDFVSPEEENFRSRGFNRDGILFHTYAEYVLGDSIGKQLVIPYDEFPVEIKETLFRKIESSSLAPQAANICDSNDFNFDENDPNFEIGIIQGAASAKTYFHKEVGNTIQRTRLKSYLITGDEVVVARKYREFACVWFPVKKKEGTIGWISVDKMTIKAMKQNPSASEWFGNWEFGDDKAFLDIGAANGSNYLMIHGGAYYYPISKQDAEKTGRFFWDDW